jgi:hypothetical protein
MFERQYFPINEEMAKTAHNMMSMRDYQEGSKTAEYKGYADKAYDLAEQIAEKRPKQAARAWKIATAYARRMADNLNAGSRIGMMCPSILITGGSNFPVKKKEKQNAAQERNYREFSEIQGYLSKLESILHGKEVIRSDDEEAIILLQEKLSSLEAQQEFMKEVNAYWRKHKKLAGCPELTPEQANELFDKMQRFWSGDGKPFPAYIITNNAANIRRTKERIDLLIKEKGRGNQEAVLDKLGITIRENVDLMRIQLFFDEKPTVEARQVLKGWGFKWAPSSGCWQRQLTNNARYAVKQVIDRLK